jgi:spermidine synthase
VSGGGPVVLERVTTPRGELVLRRDGAHYEVISNGTFLMDTRAGASERLLVHAALQRHAQPTTVLIGGLGVGFSLAAALADRRVERVVVVEIEPALLDWHRHYLGDLSGTALRDSRTEVVTADITDFLRDTAQRFDVIGLDIDNGPDWTVTDANAALYDDAGTTLLASRLADNGVLSVWSAGPAPAYETVLHRHFGTVDVHEVVVQRGQPDVVIVGQDRITCAADRGNT